MTEPDHPSRVRGCLLGGAIGDAFGYEIEFDSLERIRARFGAQGMQAPVRHRGRLVVSDDTQMTLFTAEGLVRARIAGCLHDDAGTLEHLRLATLDWHATQSADPARAQYTGTLGRSRALHARRAPGNTCMAACARGATGMPERPINDSKGCGGVMRVAPIGLVREFTVERAYALALRAAAQTHGHPEGYLPAGALAAIVRSLVDGATLEAAAAAAALHLLARTPKSIVTADAIRSALSPNTSVPALGEGWARLWGRRRFPPVGRTV